MVVQGKVVREVTETTQILDDLTGRPVETGRYAFTGKTVFESGSVTFSGGFFSRFDGGYVGLDISGDTAYGLHYLALLRRHGAEEAIPESECYPICKDEMAECARDLVSALNTLLGTGDNKE